MTFLTAIFSYNRGQLLGNCLASIERFSPPSWVVVFDDRSDDPGTEDVLRSAADRGHEVLLSDDQTEGVHGNLFRNMNRALSLARARGFRLLHLVQDDTQFLWRNDRLAEEVTGILDAFPQACQVMVHFWRRLGIADWAAVPKRRAYQMTTTGDLGFVDVDRLTQRGFRFESSERASARAAASLGCESYSVADPMVARVPWPMHARHRTMLGHQKPGKAEFLLKPLDEWTVRQLRSRDLQCPPYGEAYYSPWGWRCWKPYPIGPSHVSWLKAIAKIAVQRRSLEGLVPRRAGIPDRRSPRGAP